VALLDDVKTVLRVTTTALDTEINDLIDTAKADLGLAGVVSEKILDTYPLIKRAINVYCKANFGWGNPDSEKLMKSYEMIKGQLSLSSEYAYYAITIMVTDSITEEPIRMALVTLDGITAYTNEHGQVVFYLREPKNLVYTISCNGYISSEDEYLDAAASQIIEIALVAG